MEHEEATKNLLQARINSQQYLLKPLTAEQRERALKQISPEELDALRKL